MRGVRIREGVGGRRWAGNEHLRREEKGVAAREWEAEIIIMRW